MEKPTSVSYSSLSRFADCPVSWRSQYIDKLPGVTSESARRGNAFDELVAHRLGLQVHDRDGSIKPVPEETEELKRMLDAYAEKDFSWLRTEPTQKPRTQVKISCTPDRWAEVAEKWGSASKIHYSFIGYADLVRTMSDGIREEVLDLKTSDRAEWKPHWPMQVVTYAALMGYEKANIHLVVPQKKEVKVLQKPILLAASKEIVRNCLNWVAYYQRVIDWTIEEGKLAELPRQGGFHCNWCPLQPECTVAR